MWLLTCVHSCWPESRWVYVRGRCQCALNLTSVHSICPLMLTSVHSGVCPVLCEGRGVYVRGRCECYAGWKGVECTTPEDECVDPTCSGNGKCVGGICVCAPGYAGEACNLGNHLLIFTYYRPPIITHHFHPIINMYSVWIVAKHHPSQVGIECTN